MSALRQTNFLAGELAPLYWGRTDLPVFSRGLRTLRNFFVTRQGSAVSRPGTRHLGYTKGSGGSLPRLVPFVYSDEEAYVLEFGAEYVRFWRASDNELVEESPGVPLELETPYQADELDTLRWAQTGDVLTLTHPSYPPHELRRFDDDTWELQDLFASEIGFAPPGAAFYDIAPAPNDTTLEYMILESTLWPADATHPLKETIYLVTALLQHKATGWRLESLPTQVTKKIPAEDADAATDLDSNFLAKIAPETAVTLRRGDTITVPALPPGWSAADDYAVEGYCIYKGRKNVFGLIGTTVERDFVDDGIEPDFTLQPPRGENPFYVRNAAGVTVDFEYPRGIAFFQDRRVFGGTNLRPTTVFASQQGDYFNHDSRLIPAAGMPLVFELAARRREDIRHLVGVTRLLAFTQSSVWSIGGTGGPWDFDSVDARVEMEIGATNLPPLAIDGAVLFNRTKGVGVSGLLFDQNREGFAPADLSLFAQHLLVGQVLQAGAPVQGASIVSKAIRDWTYAEDPFGLVWACREDGAFLSLTYRPGEPTAAWARHDTDGYVKQVCAVPDGEEDAVFMVVQRGTSGLTSTYRIERMASRVRRGTPEDDACVDAAARFFDEPSLTIDGLEHLEGKEVWVVGQDNPVQGPYTVEDGEITLDELPTINVPGSGSILVPDPDRVILHVGLKFTPELETLDLVSSDTRLKQKTTVSVGIEVDQSIGLEVGQDLQHLSRWKQRRPADGFSPLSAATELVRVPVKGGWGDGARAALRQSEPLPLTVIAVTREVDLGGP